MIQNNNEIILSQLKDYYIRIKKLFLPPALEVGYWLLAFGS